MYILYNTYILYMYVCIYIIYTCLPVSPGNWLQDPPGMDTKIHLMLYIYKMA